MILLPLEMAGGHYEQTWDVVEWMERLPGENGYL